ncbi:hypothetical protein KUTeg_010874 [Tegillarca granosa]|uniref:ERAP1-like C-terminal domain-containing protein n=1 Tax=Tegillarca granosa TaxID=220873 RepID=A0ABQ9F2G3_TEGGR|nr:hypothetical protein KUTeg_010874 [Tegillarca granosa]
MYSMDSKIVKQQDFSSVVSAVSYNPNGELIAWRFIQRNWETILHWFRDVSFTLSQIIKSTVSRFSSQFDYEEVKYFFKHHDAGPGSRAVTSVLEKIQGNVDWMKHNKVDVMNWFENLKKEMKFT